MAEQQLSKTAQKYKDLLENIWEQDDSKWAAGFQSVFVEWVDQSEKIFRILVDQNKKLQASAKSANDDLDQIKKILADAAASAQAAQQEAQGAGPTAAGPPVNGNGNGRHAAPAGPTDMRNMVRLGGDDNHPLTPEEQEIEERMDMADKGQIDMSRYVPRDHPLARG